MQHKTPVAAGFTLLETVIAMSLLAFIVSDVAMVAMNAVRTSSLSQRISGAVSLAENAIEHAQGADFNRIRLVDNDQALCFTAERAEIACGDPAARIVKECFSASLAQVPCAGADAIFTRDRDVLALPLSLPLSLPLGIQPPGPPLTLPSGWTSAAPDVARSAWIEVVVTWADARGGQQEFRLASIVSRY